MYVVSQFVKKMSVDILKVFSNAIIATTFDRKGNNVVFLRSVMSGKKCKAVAVMNIENDVVYKIFFCLTGEGSGNVNDPNREMLAKTEVSLTLTNKFDVPGDENAEMDARTILLK